MDKDHTRSAWPPHSYENISFLQEHYESAVMSSQMVAQIRAIPTLRHKHHFAYESSNREALAVRWGALMRPVVVQRYSLKLREYSGYSCKS